MSITVKHAEAPIVQLFQHNPSCIFTTGQVAAHTKLNTRTVYRTLHHMHERGIVNCRSDVGRNGRVQYQWSWHGIGHKGYSDD